MTRRSPRRPGGALAILGRGISAGVDLANASVGTAGGPGQLVLAGEATGATAGVRFDGVRIGGDAMQGDVVISALNHNASVSDTQGRLMFVVGKDRASSVATAGVINIRPGGVDAAGAQMAAPDVAIGVGATEQPFQVVMDALGLSPGARVVIGGSAQRGMITYGDADVFQGDLTLQNDGAGSAGIRFTAPLFSTGLVTLSSGGAVASPDLPIVAGSLLLHGSGPASRFTLTNTGNRIGTLAAIFDTAAAGQGGVALTDSVDLVLGPLQGRGYSSAGAMSIAAPATRVDGDLLVRAAGTLVLAQDVASTGGAITLVAGTVFDNRAGASLDVATGRSWQVFADTWQGEARGNLTAAAVHPNYYSCAYGAACAATIAGNHFVYRQQPTLTLAANAQARTYGDANPALGYTVEGLVNGDNAADVLVGAYATNAGAAAHVGTYAITGSFTSPVGYAIDALPGTLAVNRAPLLVAIADQQKVYGGADPQLAASYTGLKLDDTGAVVSGLQLAAPTGPAAMAGTHAITGSGATAGDYAIAYQNGVLHVAPALLTYTATPVVLHAGAPVDGLAGTVTGFVYGDALATATTGTLAFTAPAGRVLRAGTYAVQGGGLAAANYVFAQAPSNQGALVVLADPGYLAPAPWRDLTFANSALYDQNLGALRVCVGAGALAAAGSADVNDALGVEWSRVRVSPNLSNCFSLGQRNGCQDF